MPWCMRTIIIERAMNIGEAARRAGINAKRVRHYEAIGLVPRAKRSQGNYRAYSEADVHTLRFIRQEIGRAHV